MFNPTVHLLMFAGMSLAIASCGQPHSSNEETKDQDAKLPVYEVNWRFCADTANAIVNADSQGCAQNNRPLYVWGSSDIEQLDNYQPQAVLLRTSPPTRLASYVGYRVAIRSHGCFPQNLEEPGSVGYYSADRVLQLDKDFAANREVIEIEVNAKRVASSEEVTEIFVDYQAGNQTATFGEECALLNYQG